VVVVVLVLVVLLVLLVQVVLLRVGIGSEGRQGEAGASAWRVMRA